MPPQLALLLCTAFVLVLLRLEWRRSRDVSAAMWIPTAWMLLASSRSLAAWFGTWFGTAGSNDSGSVLDQLMLMGLASAGVVVLVVRRFDWLDVLRRQKALITLLAFMFISTFWSDITLIAMKRWVREAIVVLMAVVVMSEAYPLASLQSLLRRSAYVLIPFSVVLIKYYPTLGRQYGRWSGIEMWTGVASQKNGLGRLCMISIFFLVWALIHHCKKGGPVVMRYQSWADVSVILIALYLLEGANSSTSLATLTIGFTLLAVLGVCRKLKITVPRSALATLVTLLIGFGASAPFRGGTDIAAFSSSLGRDSTLTGRTEVWADVIPNVKTRPLFGSGFGSFWTDARRKLYDIPTAHNGYLDILLEQGGTGLALYTIWLLSCARKMHRALGWDYDWGSLAICILIMGLVYNCTESALNSLTEHMTAVVVFASCAVSARSKEARIPVKRIRSTGNTPFEQVGVHGGEDVWW